MMAASARSAGQVVLVVLTRAALGPQPWRHRCAGEVDLGVGIERGLVGPQFQQRELVGVLHTLKYLELFAAGFLRDVGAALPEGLREFRPFAWGRIDRDDQPNLHGVSPMRMTSKSNYPSAAPSSSRLSS